MMKAKGDQPKTFALKSALLMLLGSLLLGFVITKSIYDYQKYNSPLDAVDVEIPVEENAPALVLDEYSASGVAMAQSPEPNRVQAYVEEQVQGDDEAIVDYYRRIPKHISIPSIGLDSEIGFASVKDVEVFGETYQQWVAPKDVVGWHYKSAVLGKVGNTVLNGHHNVMGEVFRELSMVRKGDQVIVSAEAGDFYYQVAVVMILPERFESREVRLQNARWIQHSEDERLTLISCWPYESNTHRVIVVAFPIVQPADRGGENIRLVRNFLSWSEGWR
jgi:LPXTG-site transpeptidase (sortase) family protein